MTLLKWDKIYKDGAKFPPLNEVFISILLKEIQSRSKKKPQSLIDLGCGTGQDIISFAQNGLEVAGIDGSKEAIRKATIECQINEVSPVFLRTEKEFNVDLRPFDIILCKLVYAFVGNQKAFLKKVQSEMHNKATFVLITPLLHKNISYTKDDKPGIAVEYDVLMKRLQKTFSKVIEFHHHYPQKRMDIGTFICLK